jgi:hypothetical protein
MSLEQLKGGQVGVAFVANGVGMLGAVESEVKSTAEIAGSSREVRRNPHRATRDAPPSRLGVGAAASKTKASNKGKEAAKAGESRRKP